MERHANKTNVIETIKVPLQKTTKSGRTIFAYMRRSTTKKEQASSLPQQEEMIEYIANELWIDIENIKPYIESKSWYENRKRPEWNKMLGVIDSLKEPCIILCRDTSRLSRNPKDNLAIADRMFCDNDFKNIWQKIWNIYFLDGMKVVEWNEKTEKKYVADTLHQNYTDSIENKSKCIWGVLSKLNMWEFPYCPPHWLSRVNKDGLKRMSRSEKTTLMQDGEMPFIYHAFEMKAKWRTAKEICQYLKQYGNIHISGKVLVETLFANTVYKWVYTEKTTGTLFDKIKFWEGKPPIDPALWERANANINKRGYGFGEWQAEHIAQWILKHESGKSLYMYKAKGKYNAYQTEIKGENGKRKSIWIMESKLVKEFLNKAIPKISLIYYLICEDTKKDIAKASIEMMKEVILEWKEWQKQENKQEAIEERIVVSEDTKKEAIEMASNMLWNLLFNTSTERFGSILNIDHTARGIKEVSIKEFEQQKKKLQEEKMCIDKKALRLWYGADVANEMKQDVENEIQDIETQIELLSESSNIEEYLYRMPEILLDLHELSSRVLSEADYEGMRNDIKQLIEITSHELILNNKKELKIKLSDVLESLETGKISNGAQTTAHTRTVIREFVENYDKVKAKYSNWYNYPIDNNIMR